MKKIIIILLVLGVLVSGYYIYQRQDKAPIDEAVRSDNTPTDQSTTTQDNNTQTPEKENQAAPTGTASKEPSAPSQNKPSTSTFSSGEEAEMSPDILVVEISYDGQKFSPNTENIKVGDIVVFRNNGSKDFWPASDQHPVHTAYPEFDAKGAVAPGGKYQFQFLKAGTWGFHDHLNPEVTGTVNVSK